MVQGIKWPTPKNSVYKRHIINKHLWYICGHINESSAFSISFYKPLGFLMYLVDGYACVCAHITLNVGIQELNWCVHTFFSLLSHRAGFL